MSEAGRIRQAPNDSVEFRASVVRLALIFLGSLVLAALAVWMARNAEIDPFRRLVGWLGAPFFLLCAIISVLRSFNRPVVIVSPDGIQDTRISPQFIPWTAVESVSTIQVRDVRFIVLNLSAPAYANLQLSSLTRITSRSNQAYGMDCVHIGTVELPVKFDEFHSTVTSFARARGVKVD
ncbi:STM3941 family protein [Aminobacter sp. MDW-2]|uniref:STM3941 family protein n=1 Tax=Aminobacter sp. MDW-2 TaxID=2666139 RepID=UPI00353022D5